MTRERNVATKLKKPLFVFCLLSLTLSACAGATLPNESPLTREDRAEIVRLSLERALVDQEVPDYQLIKDKKNIVLSMANIDVSLIPTLPGINLIPLTREEIQAKANSEGDFLYLEFIEIEAESDAKATASLGNTWAVAQDSETLYLSGGGFTIEYTKNADGWLSEVVAIWMS
jgi:hypothetical protein